MVKLLYTEKILLANMILSVLILLAMIVFIIYLFKSAHKLKKDYKKYVHSNSKIANACQALTCGASDPVSDPDYNMKEIAKQSILLEEHLTVETKYCVDCVAKHMLHIHGLAMEAVMLACDNVSKYPYMEESPAFYKRMFDEWLAKREDHQARLHIAGELREFRKKLVAAYYLEPTSTKTHA